MLLHTVACIHHQGAMENMKQNCRKKIFFNNIYFIWNSVALNASAHLGFYLWKMWRIPKIFKLPELLYILSHYKHTL